MRQNSLRRSNSHSIVRTILTDAGSVAAPSEDRLADLDLTVTNDDLHLQSLDFVDQLALLLPGTLVEPSRSWRRNSLRQTHDVQSWLGGRQGLSGQECCGALSRGEDGAI